METDVSWEFYMLLLAGVEFIDIHSLFNVYVKCLQLLWKSFYLEVR